MQGHVACQPKPVFFWPDPSQFPDVTAVTAAFPEGGEVIIFIFFPRGNPVKYTDPDGRQVIPIPLPIPFSLPFPKVLPFPGTVVPPLIINPSNPLKTERSGIFQGHEIDMGDTTTWPKPPGEGPFIEGEPSRNGPRERGEKSLYDKDGGEWRPHLQDKFHPKEHWDYKAPADPKGNKFPEWDNIYPTVPVKPSDTYSPMA
jgi:hypothetical protein